MLKFIFSFIVSLLVSMVNFSIPAHATVDPYQSIENFAQSFIKEQLILEKNEKANIYVAKIDRRVKISTCENNMTAVLVGNKKLQRSATVRINCESAQPWRLHVVIKITRTVPVIVTSRPLSKGSQLSQSNTKIKYINKALLRSGTITDLQYIRNARLKRQLSNEQMVLSRDICLVCKGETVTIESSVGSLTVKTDGIALSNGVLNQNIRVENKKSKRIVSGIVKSAGLVSIKN